MCYTETDGGPDLAAGLLFAGPCLKETVYSNRVICKELTCDFEGLGVQGEEAASNNCIPLAGWGLQNSTEGPGIMWQDRAGLPSFSCSQTGSHVPRLVLNPLRC